MAESRGQVEDRLKREGRWGAFLERWAELKSQGLSGSAAYQKVLAEFTEPPPTEKSGDDDWSIVPDLEALTQLQAALPTRML